MSGLVTVFASAPLPTRMGWVARMVMAAPTAAQFSEPPVMDKPQAGYYRFKIGRVDVIAVSDGGGAFDILGVVPREKQKAAARIMAKSLVKSPVFVSVNAYVVLLDGRTIMVDAGTGELFGVKKNPQDADG